MHNASARLKMDRAILHYHGADGNAGIYIPGKIKKPHGAGINVSAVGL